MATMEDVAKMAGVGVNRFPCDQQDPVVRKRPENVFSKLCSLDYYPNYLSQLASQKSVIGVLMPDITNPFYVRVVSGIER